jgi:hypothetical protein
MSTVKELNIQLENKPGTLVVQFLDSSTKFIQSRFICGFYHRRDRCLLPPCGGILTPKAKARRFQIRPFIRPAVSVLTLQTHATPRIQPSMSAVLRSRGSSSGIKD